MVKPIATRLAIGIEPLLKMCEAPRVGRSIFRPQIACVMTALTLAGVKGIERKRTPVASNTALAIAEGMTAALGSPAPQGFSVGRSINSITISGTCGNVRIG